MALTVHHSWLMEGVQNYLAADGAGLARRNRPSATRAATKRTAPSTNTIPATDRLSEDMLTGEVILPLPVIPMAIRAKSLSVLRRIGLVGGLR